MPPIHTALRTVSEKVPMSETPETSGQVPKFDPIAFTLSKPLATPRELAAAFDQLIDSICDLTETRVERTVTPSLTAVTVSWQSASLPSNEWLAEVQSQLEAFGACTGVQVRFRRH